METQIWEQVGSPKENVDWTDPESWIPERLNGAEKTLAVNLWRKSKNQINPRHSIGCWRLVNRHGLMVRNGQNCLEITERGNVFLKDDEGNLIAEVDRYEGLLTILQLVSEHGPCQRKDILPGYSEFCSTYTHYQSEAVYKSSLYDRLVNLIDRKLIERSGIRYGITDTGIAYLQKYAALIPGRTVTTKQTELEKMVRAINREARERLADYLAQMDPFKFEKLISLLLQEMGYDNVRVTAPSNDKGVDVVADFEVGISSVREVVQVKRHSGSINRTVLDQLRGSLHRFKAMRGTIITIGTFSAGAKSASLEQGAAPITLIDGGKLLELLIDNQIGITKRSIDFFEFDDSRLTPFDKEQPESPDKE
jgi:restriction system protein